MANNVQWSQFEKVIFERGICINKNLSGEWFYDNSEDHMSVADPGNVIASLGVRPVLAEGSNKGTRVSLVLPAIKGRLLEIYRSELDLPAPLKYLMGSILYHCSVLARIYADECKTVARKHQKIAGRNNLSSLEEEKRFVTRFEEPLYSFETLMTKIIIGYESLRYPVWKKYKSGNTIPKNYLDTMKSCKFPSAIGKRIKLSTENCYLPAKKYKNCIQKNVDIGSSSWCVFEKKFQLLWYLVVHLPDNPEEKSASAFTFDQDFDALTVAWEYVSEFFALTDIIIGDGNLSSV
jgi:hypothetical protein